MDAESIHQYEGTGIWLALTKKSVELHQGRVTVSSSKEAITFIFSLSVNLKDNEQIEIITEPPEEVEALETKVNLQPIVKELSDVMLTMLNKMN